MPSAKKINNNTHYLRKLLKYVTAIIYDHRTKWDKWKGKKYTRGYTLLWLLNSTPVRFLGISLVVIIILAITMANGFTSFIDTLLIASCMVYNGLMLYGVTQRSVRNRYTSVGAIVFALLWTFWVLWAIVTEVAPVIELFFVGFVGGIVIKAGMIRIPTGHSAVLRIIGTDKMEVLKEGIHVFTPYMFRPLKLRWRIKSYDTIDNTGGKPTITEMTKIQTSQVSVQTGSLTCVMRDGHVVNVNCSATMDIGDLSLFCLSKAERAKNVPSTYRNLSLEDYNPPNIMQKEVGMTITKQCKDLTLSDALRGNYQSLLVHVLDEVNKTLKPVGLEVIELTIDQSEVVSGLVPQGGGMYMQQQPPPMQLYREQPNYDMPIHPEPPKQAKPSAADVQRTMKELGISVKEVMELVDKGIDITEKKEEQKKEQ